MSNLWSEAGFPHLGWRCINVTDLKTDDHDDDYERGSCEACGRSDLRFVHTLEHSDYDRDVETGCECAAKLERDKAGPKAREHRLKNLAKRRANWLTRYWMTSQKGGKYLNIEGYTVGVNPHGSQWRYWMARKGTKDYFGKSGWYSTESEAKLALFAAFAKFRDW